MYPAKPRFGDAGLWVRCESIDLLAPPSESRGRADVEVALPSGGCVQLVESSCEVLVACCLAEVGQGVLCHPVRSFLELVSASKKPS